MIDAPSYKTPKNKEIGKGDFVAETLEDEKKIVEYINSLK
jgi:hypothetical protein